jgi:hypothetical protein
MVKSASHLTFPRARQLDPAVGEKESAFLIRRVPERRELIAGQTATCK